MKKVQKRIKTSHGRTRNLTEGTEAETRTKTEAAEALATEGYGISRKEEYKEEQEWNPAFAKLTIAWGRHLPSFPRRRESRNTGRQEETRPPHTRS